MILLAIRSPGAIALIGAIAGVLGAVAGSIAGGWATYKVEYGRQQFQRHQDLRAEARDRDRYYSLVRGIARVWATKLDDISDYIDQSLAFDPPSWWSEPFDVDTTMSVEDMKAIAAVLSEDDWREVDIGLAAIRVVQADVALHRSNSSNPNNLGISSEDVERLRENAPMIRDAQAVLSRLSASLSPLGNLALPT